VPAQVRSEDVEAAGEPLLGELAEAPAVTLDAVQADDRRSARSAPLMGVELQLAASARRFAARSQRIRTRPLNGRMIRQ